MAHVFAASKNGPRPNVLLSKAQRGAFENLILLCSACHTIIDKSEQDFPDDRIVRWKRDHDASLAKLFGVVCHHSRAEVRGAIEPLLEENRVIHEEYNPDLEYRSNPESEYADVWRANLVERVIPNNRRILATLDLNRNLATIAERRIVELFRQHIHDLEAKHLTELATGAARRFPDALNQIMGGADVERARECGQVGWQHSQGE